jgi:hypothetical protein
MLLSLAGTMSVVAQSTPEMSPVVEHCRQLMNASQPADSGPDAPTIQIVEPTDDGVVYGSQLAVTVETDNFEINSEGKHWHIWVDGQLQMMLYGPTAVINVAPGTHEVCAIMSDGNHVDLGSPAGITLTVAQPAAGTPTTTPAVAPEVAATYSQTEGSSISPLLLVAFGALAAVGGWWLGTRMGKRR